MQTPDLQLSVTGITHAQRAARGPGVAAVAADLRDPAAVLANPELRAATDPAEPVCVILGTVLHFLDAGTAREVTGVVTSVQVRFPGSIRSGL